MTDPAAAPASVPTELVLPIFPLADVTLFPHAVMALHVFEARYRAMVTDTLARDRRLAIVRLLPGYEADYAGKPPVGAVAGAGEIVKWERLPGGRYNILVQGRWRVRLGRELPSDTLYRLVHLRRLAEEPPRGDVSGLLARVRTAGGRLLDALERPRDLLATLLADGEPPGVIADRAAAAFLPDADLRQELLEMLAVQTRLERVSAALEALADEVRGGRGGPA
jgi:Lon protease-like protein